MAGIILALLSALAYAIGNTLAKHASRASSPLIVSIFILLWHVVFLLPLVLAYGLTLPENSDWTVLALAAGGGILGYVAFLKSFQKLTIGETLVIANTSPILLLTVSHVSTAAFWGVFCMFLGVVCIAAEQPKNIRYLWIPFLTAFGWAVYTYGLKYFLDKGHSPWATLFIIEGAMGILGLSYLLFARTPLKDFIRMASPAFFEITGAALLTFSLGYISPAVSASIGSTQMFIAAALGAIFFKERLTKRHLYAFFFMMLGMTLFKHAAGSATKESEEFHGISPVISSRRRRDRLRRLRTENSR